MSSARYDVLVIGAGVAGLAAGRVLAESGKTVAVLEARGRVGGRIWTRQASSGSKAMPVELGAEFIHGLVPEIHAITREAGLQTYELEGSSWWFSDGRWADADWQQKKSTRILDGLKDYLAGQPRDCDVSFAEFLKTAPVDVLTAQTARNYVEGFNAADENRIGIAGLSKQQQAEEAVEADRLFRVRDGYSGIPNFLAQQFERAGGKLLLSTAARRVAWKPKSVSIEARHQSGAKQVMHARQAVIAVPLGVLQADTIEFAPRPDEILLHANRMIMGSAVRLVMIFRKRFWSEWKLPAQLLATGARLEHLSFLFTPSELPSTWWTPFPDETAMLTAWAGGPKAAQLGQLTATQGGEALLNRCLGALSTVFDCSRSDLEGLLLSWHSHDWDGDQYTRGAYSYVPVKALDAPQEMARPVQGTLFFAGEHTDTSGLWGTVHAALATGIAAAGRLLAAS